MKDLLWEVKYELTRTLKHIFYALLAVCWFAIWYGIFFLITGEWDVVKWEKPYVELYWILSVATGFGYGLLRVMT